MKADGCLQKMEANIASIWSSVGQMEVRISGLEDRMVTIEDIMASMEKWATTNFSLLEEDNDSEYKEDNECGIQVPIQLVLTPTSPPVTLSTGPATCHTSLVTPALQRAPLPASSTAGTERLMPPPLSTVAVSAMLLTTEDSIAAAVPQSSLPGLSIISPTPHSLQEATMDTMPDPNLLHAPGQIGIERPRGMKHVHEGTESDPGK